MVSKGKHTRLEACEKYPSQATIIYCNGAVKSPRLKTKTEARAHTEKLFAQGHIGEIERDSLLIDIECSNLVGEKPSLLMSIGVGLNKDETRDLELFGGCIPAP